MYNQYNNKEIAKLRLVNSLNKIRNKNNDISSVSITFFENKIIKNCPYKKNKKEVYNIIKPEISICIKEQYILKFHKDTDFFTYYKKNEKKITENNISFFEKNYSSLCYEKNKTHYINKHRVSCNKFHNIFSIIFNALNTNEYFIEDKNKIFTFDFKNSEIYQNQVNIFYGINLCHILFNEELEKDIPQSTNYTKKVVKF